MLENKTLLQNRYLIERQIGSGGMGAVYLAVDQRFGSYVAIKETFYKDDELADAFGREAHLLNSLHHPVLPHVSDYFTENNGHFLVMQFIEGEDLFVTLKREGAFPFKDVVRWTESLLDALDYLHSQEPPIIHRDIKPQNLKITLRGDIILLDFGLAKLSSDENTGMKSVFGYSRKYSPLEQIQGTGTDARSDLFALAATVYHLLTGKPPLDALTRASAIVNGDADPLRPASELNDEIPVEIADVLTAALALNASKRFVSAKAMRQALDNAIEAGVKEESKELPEQPVFIPSAENLVPDSPETESFPALDAFAAETVNSAAIQNSAAEPDLRGVFQPDAEADLINQENQPPIIHVPVEESAIDVKKEGIFSSAISGSAADIRVPRKNRSRSAAAIFAVLIFSCLAVWYYINAANSPVEANPNPVVRSSSETIPDIETASETLPSPEPEAVESPVVEVKKEVKARKEREEKPLKTEVAVEKSEPAEDIPTQVGEAEKPKPVQPKPENKRPNIQKTPAVVQPPRRENPAPAAQSEVPDIESVFTGRSSQERAKGQQRRENQRLREQMTPEEREEFRRIRRQERQQRRNRQSFPPF